mgnify:CR=1 FL=1
MLESSYMKIYRYALLLLTILSACSGSVTTERLPTPYELGNGNQTATYEETIRWWRQLEEASPYVKLLEAGKTDSGEPLHLVVVNKRANFNLESLKERKRPLLLINNGIHPGEPDGVDASMLYIRKLLQDEKEQGILDEVIIAVIPMFNIGGSLNRNCCSRANQNGPEAYGFRGNARNLDLNRDFIKADSRNAQSFIQLVSALDPDVYLETHVSNGADYPYTLTYLYAHHAKQTPPLDSFVYEEFELPIKAHFDSIGDHIIPYVNVFGTTPDSGYTAFYDSPRYSTGFLSLRHTIALLTETHMLKPYSARVRMTEQFMHTLTQRIAKLGDAILEARADADRFMLQQQRFALAHVTNRKAADSLLFKGYEARYDSSVVTGLPQLSYNPASPWERKIPYYNQLTPTTTVQAPLYYVIPTAWHEVIERLKWNGVVLVALDRDTQMTVSQYRILDFETVETPYEGHYLHSKTSVVAEPIVRRFHKGSYVLASTDQRMKRFLIETLEPSAPDAYFNWNFYDEILQQKEWFSSYVFEPEAVEMLKDPEHRKAFEQFLMEHPEHAENAFAQLYFLYKRSPHFEVDRFMIYPVFRIDETN